MNTVTSESDILIRIERRLDILADADCNSSTIACATDAEHCLDMHVHGVAFPTFRNDNGTLPATWLAAADGWLDRAGQHQFGFALPEGW